MLEEILEEQSKTELLLNYLSKYFIGYSIHYWLIIFLKVISDYIDIFQQVFQLSGVLSILNLSSNFLGMRHLVANEVKKSANSYRLM